MKYLEDEQHYIDRYDLLTIKECLWSVNFWRKKYKEKSKDKKTSKKDQAKAFYIGMNFDLWVTKGEGYKRKKDTIRKWMEDARIKQDKYDNTPEPSNIRCNDCGGLMHNTFKHLDGSFDDNEHLRVLFFFGCPSCKKRRSFYEDGKELFSKPQLCTKCNCEVKTTHKKKGKVITWTAK